MLILGRLNGIVEEITGFDLGRQTSFETVLGSRKETEYQPAVTTVEKYPHPPTIYRP